ncbi:hypothetical protein JHK86_036162 [Glycine max]|nr:hypothetical protein JHK86_036162 [Glycine max]
MSNILLLEKNCRAIIHYLFLQNQEKRTQKTKSAVTFVLRKDENNFTCVPLPLPILFLYI